MKKLFLVSCVSKKSDGPCAAKDLYVSPWFCKARSYAERESAGWFILSARYGLLSPDAVIEKYEETLTKKKSTDRREWAASVMNNLRPHLAKFDSVTLLAGKSYRQFLLSELQRHFSLVEIPLEGLGIGKQLSWLKTRIQNGLSP